MPEMQGTQAQPAAVGPSFSRRFTSQDPLETVKWRTTDAVIKDPAGNVMFEARGIEAPAHWSDRAINITAEKYFRVINGTRETSVKQVIRRITKTIAEAAYQQGIFPTLEQTKAFQDDLAYLIVDQRFAFNSPVWFNVGVVPSAQASACFIQSIDDTMESLTETQAREVRLFKGGSGTGSNLSRIRSSYEKLSGGGHASGPVSFMQAFDAWAGSTKSGGTTRRAAKMAILDADHPDILEQKNGSPGFITCKSHAEQVAHDLYATGKYSAEFNVAGNVYELVPFQNANNSVRASDAFMTAVEQKKTWTTYARTDGSPVKTYAAEKLWDEIINAAWFCGDPGLQFDDTINMWHTCKESGRIKASNPCSEFLFLDNSACNLGSLNLMKFVDEDGVFDTKTFVSACEVAIIAMEALVDPSTYPSPDIAENSHKFRPLGLGYANLGAVLTYLGLPYDSDAGRNLAASITALMSAAAYRQSVKLARIKGPFEAYPLNRQSMLDVLHLHVASLSNVNATGAAHPIAETATFLWDDVIEGATAFGVRNSQISLLAPTGTIGFVMDCDTTGIEPMLLLVQHKKLVGGGSMRLPNRIVKPALERLGYNGTSAKILQHMEATGEIFSSPDLKAEHKKVFQTSIGQDPIPPEAHLKMMAAVQPFLSGGISKTVNVANDATPQMIGNLYWQAWKMGLKCVAIYRDACKLSQPAGATLEAKKKAEAKKELAWNERKRLPDERVSLTHRFSIGPQDGYIHAGLYEDGKVGEIFIDVAKAGSALSGFMDMFATAMSIGLQYGAPLETFVNKLRDTKFEPAGITRNPDIRIASSIPDYLARWLELKFLNGEPQKLPDVADPEKLVHQIASGGFNGDPCSKCGNVTVRAGSCWVCQACGTTTGCG